MSNPRKIINKMFDQDAFSQWLGIEIIDVSEGFCQLKMTVRKEMLNGFQIAHGGIAYSLADSALAFASNSHGRKSLSVETSISHTVSVKEGDVLTMDQFTSLHRRTPVMDTNRLLWRIASDFKKIYTVAHNYN